MAWLIPLILGPVSHHLSFHWQLTPDLLASPRLNRNKIYILKRPTCAHEPISQPRLQSGPGLACSHLPADTYDKASNCTKGHPLVTCRGKQLDSQGRKRKARQDPLADPCRTAWAESPKSSLEPAVSASAFSRRFILGWASGLAISTSWAATVVCYLHFQLGERSGELSADSPRNL